MAESKLFPLSFRYKLLLLDLIELFLFFSFFDGGGGNNNGGSDDVIGGSGFFLVS